MRRRPACWSSAATARAWRRCRARSASSTPTSRCWNSRPGIASPMTASSPHAGIVAQRMTALSRLARLQGDATGRRGAAHHRQRRAPARAGTRSRRRPGARRPRPATCSPWTASSRWLELNGFSRTATVREAGEYAVRGGIIDLYRARRGRAGAARLLRRYAGIDPQLRSRDPAQHRSAARARPRAGRRVPAHHRDHPPFPHRLCAKPSARRRPTICSTRR